VHVRREIDTTIGWLRLQGSQFYYQPYEQLVAYLRKQGRDADAKTVLVAKADDRARLIKMAFPERCWHWFLGWTIGYGYRPWRALVMSIAVITGGSLIFLIGHEAKIIRETKVVEYVEYVALADPNSPRKLRVRKDYPDFNFFVYSLDMFIPLVDLRQAAYWLPGPREPDEAENTRKSTSVPARAGKTQIEEVSISVRLLRVYMWFHILAGWVLSSLLVVGLGGLVKR
jgi:hypothetical protein